MREIAKGATSQTLYLVALDSASTTGGRKTGIVYNAAGLTAYYVRNRAASVAIALVTLANSSAAWASGGFVEVDATNAPGLYRLDVPDAAFATGVDSVVVVVRGAAGMVQVEEEVLLVAYNPQDAAALGLSRVDAAITSRATPAQILTTPANLLATDGTGRVTVGTNADKTGYSLSTAPPTVTQIWGEPVPGTYAVGSAGNIVGSRLDVAVSTRATSTAGGTVGPGSRQVTINVQHPGNTGPLEGAACWVSTDQAGTNVIAGTLHTDTSGNVQFMLDNGTYWLWRQLSPYLFTPNPQSFTVS